MNSEIKSSTTEKLRNVIVINDLKKNILRNKLIIFSTIMK